MHFLELHTDAIFGIAQFLKIKDRIVLFNTCKSLRSIRFIAFKTDEYLNDNCPFIVIHSAPFFWNCLNFTMPIIKKQHIDHIEYIKYIKNFQIHFHIKTNNNIRPLIKHSKCSDSNPKYSIEYEKNELSFDFKIDNFETYKFIFECFVNKFGDQFINYQINKYQYFIESVMVHGDKKHNADRLYILKTQTLNISHFQWNKTMYDIETIINAYDDNFPEWLISLGLCIHFLKIRKTKYKYVPVYFS